MILDTISIWSKKTIIYMLLVEGNMETIMFLYLMNASDLILLLNNGKYYHLCIFLGVNTSVFYIKIDYWYLMVCRKIVKFVHILKFLMILRCNGRYLVLNYLKMNLINKYTYKMTIFIYFVRILGTQ